MTGDLRFSLDRVALDSARGSAAKRKLGARGDEGVVEHGVDERGVGLGAPGSFSPQAHERARFPISLSMIHDDNLRDA